LTAEHESSMMFWSSTAASSTVRASGPTWSRLQLTGMTPSRLTRPYVGLRPTTPQKAAGMRIEPPVSVPMEPWQSPAETAAADPLDEPPGVLVGSHGLRISPNSALGAP